MRVEDIRETYTYHCRRCGALWSWEYDVQRFGGHGGSVIETFYRGGRAQSPPWSVCCPYCKGLRVEVAKVDGPVHPLGRGPKGPW